MTEAACLCELPVYIYSSSFRELEYPSKVISYASPCDCSAKFDSLCMFMWIHLNPVICVPRKHASFFAIVLAKQPVTEPASQLASNKPANKPKPSSRTQNHQLAVPPYPQILRLAAINRRPEPRGATTSHGARASRLFAHPWAPLVCAAEASFCNDKCVF